MSRSKYFAGAQRDTSQAVFCPFQGHKQHVSTRICIGYFCLAYRTKSWCAVWMKMKGNKHKQKTICNLLQPFVATSQSELNSPRSQLRVSGTCNIWNTWSDTIHNRIQHKSNVLYINLYSKSVLCEHMHCNSMQCSNSWLQYGLVAMALLSYKTLGLSFVIYLLVFLENISSLDYSKRYSKLPSSVC
jgi:hypothetical protein